MTREEYRKYRRNLRLKSAARAAVEITGGILVMLLYSILAYVFLAITPPS